MIKNLLPCLFIASIIGLSSCANYRVKYRQTYIHTNTDTLKKADFVLYLIGDAGNAPAGKSSFELEYLGQQLQKESSESAIVWLGDNIYPVGLAPEAHTDHALGRHRLEKQLECHDDYKGRVYFIPGNHDWYEYGKEGIIRQENLIEEYLNTKRQYNPYEQSNYFLPDKACGDIHGIELTDELYMIIMDSNWYLQEEREQYNNCCFSSSEEFLDRLREKIRSHTDKQLIICLHHPPYSYGSHGSHFTFRDYAFPLTQINSNLWIPLPFSGIVINQMRAYLTEQDIKHRKYQLLKQLIEEELQSFRDPIVASGHEHNLQYISKDNVHYIVSGAGSKRTAVALGQYSEFAVAKNGYVKILFYENEFRIEYIIPKDSERNIYFSKDVKKSDGE